MASYREVSMDVELTRSLDLHGRGYSEAPKKVLETNDYIVQLGLLLQYIGWSSVKVVGFSMVLVASKLSSPSRADYDLGRRYYSSLYITLSSPCRRQGSVHCFRRSDRGKCCLEEQKMIATYFRL